MTVTSTTTERIERGAALLDKESPDWRERVDVKKFNIRNQCACVLGQLYGEYGTGCRALELAPYPEPEWQPEDDNPVNYGFFAPPGSANWDALQEGWEQELRR